MSVILCDVIDRPLTVVSLVCSYLLADDNDVVDAVSRLNVVEESLTTVAVVAVCCLLVTLL